MDSYRTPKKINRLLDFALFPHPKKNCFVPSLHQPRRVSDPVYHTRQFKCHKRSKTESPVSCMLVCMSVYYLQSILSVLLPLCSPPLFSAPFSSAALLSSSYSYCCCCPHCTRSPRCTHSPRCCCCVLCLCLHQLMVLLGYEQP